MAAFLRRNWRPMAVGLVLGGIMEALLIRGGFYDQMRRARADHLEEDWQELGEDGRRAVMEVERRYRQIKEKN